jgi:formylglycine-generating enzyme required for sulfatase activity
MPPSVFISHASEDKEAADTVCRALEKAGFVCWIAPRDIGGGANYPATIVEAVNSAGAVVLILSAHAVASPHVLTEVGQAFDGRKPIIPFRLTPVELSAGLDYYLSLTQWLDAFEGITDQNLGRLVEATRGALAGRTNLVRRARAKRPIVLVAGIGLALAAAAAGIVYWKWPERATDIPPVTKQPPILKEAPPQEPAGPKWKTWVNPKDGLTYVWIPPGLFTMGCSPGDDQCEDDEKPAHRVRIGRGFWLGQTEVTAVAYGRAGGDLPVTRVTWLEAKKYCEAKGGRLPAEAEWEYAARAGSSEATYGVLSEIAWYEANSDGTLHQVGRKEPNAFGLHDMLGNASEWVLDRYYNKYDVDAPHTGTAVEQPLAPPAFAAIRGGFFGGSAAYVRASHRTERFPDDSEPFIGFRCANDRP